MIIKRAREVLRIERDAIDGLIGRIDREFAKAVELLYRTKGRIIVTGMGKPGFIAQKISATMASVGSPSLYLHPAEALHGDLGRVTKADVILCLSNSGETEELLKLLPILRKIGAKLISIVGNTSSTLAKNSDCVLDATVKKEACSLNLAPTASTTAMLALGDAIAIALLDKRGFKETDFALYHPGGMLGKRLLLKVEDIMRTGAANPLVRADALVKDVLLTITRARAGSACVVDGRKKLIGIFTDGDLRRNLEKDDNIARKKVSDVMTRGPVTVGRERLAVEALAILQAKRIDEIPVVDGAGRPVGLVDVQDLLKAGLV